jgi:hypothetical protein
MTVKKEIVFSTFRGDMCDPTEYYVPYKEASAGIERALALADERVKEERRACRDIVRQEAYDFERSGNTVSVALHRLADHIHSRDHLTPPTGGEGLR